VQSKKKKKKKKKKEEEEGGRGIYYVWEIGELHTGSWWVKLRERTSLVDLGVDCRIILKWIFKKWEGTWNRLFWLRIGTGGGQMRW
jgi:hypothetical protein